MCLPVPKKIERCIGVAGLPDELLQAMNFCVGLL
jgi:hypothetical protein